jgi:hypothetical protein
MEVVRDSALRNSSIYTPERIPVNSVTGCTDSWAILWPEKYVNENFEEHNQESKPPSSDL